MAEVKWIKIATDIFDDEKILLIESLPEGDSIIVIWFKLLALAGKSNNSGVFMINDKMPYTDEMLATIFRRNKNTVRLALETFSQFGMIEIIDDTITIPNWGKHQNLEQLENRRDYQREYQRKYRQKQKGIACKSNSEDEGEDEDEDLRKHLRKHLRKDDVNTLDKEEEREEDKIIDVSDKSDTLSPTAADYAQIVAMWNKLDGLGNIKGIKGISDKGKRRNNVRARFKEYGIEGFREAIDKIKDSDFLQGKNKKGWTVTFDWFILPSNFPKVLEGNYNAGKPPSGKYAEISKRLLQETLDNIEGE